MKNFFTCLMMMSALPMMAIAQSWSGEGTEDNPYQITSDEEMQAFAASVNSGNAYDGVYFSLSEDVTTGPIAADGNIFSGVFDGNGHTVTVSIHSGYNEVGLFGHIENATIRELKVAGNLSNLGDITDEGGFGALVGYAKNSTITDCHNSADIDCAYKCNGGICGYSEGSTIQYCTNSGDVRALQDNQDRTGGICGLNDGGTITHCSNSGHISGDDGIGGIVGRNEKGGTTRSCINSGVVEGDLYVGGIVGEIYSLTPLRSAQEAQIAYCYNEGGVIGNEYVAGIVGEADGNIIEACYNVGTVRGGSDEVPAAGIAGGENATITDCGYLKGCVSDSDEGMEATDLINTMSTFFTQENGWESSPSLGENGEIVAPVLAMESYPDEPDKPTGIEDVEQAKVYTQEGGVYVQTTQPAEVIIVSMNGSIIKQEMQIGTKRYELSRGIYVICIDNQRYKVRI